MDAPLAARREELASLLSGRDGSGVPGPGSTQVLLTPQTDDAGLADAWFETFEALGLDGVVAKKVDIRYQPGQRAMVKVKKVKTADCVVGAYRPSRADEGIGSLLLGLYRDGVLHFVGHTSLVLDGRRKRLRGC